MLKQRRPTTADPIARRGHALYTKRIRRKLVGETKGRVVAVDIRSADFEVADNALAAARQLLARRPGASIWLERIGYRSLRRFGAWRSENSNVISNATAAPLPSISEPAY